MTKTITIPATVITAKAQGVVRDIDPTTFHDDSIAAIFAYGLRRWFQDSINSQAHIARQDEVAFDAEAAFVDRLKQAESGEINRRGTGSAVSDETLWARRAVREMAKVNDKLKTAISEHEAGDARNTYIDSVATKNADVINPIAARLRKEDAAKRKAASDAATELAI